MMILCIIAVLWALLGGVWLGLAIAWWDSLSLAYVLKFRSMRGFIPTMALTSITVVALAPLITTGCLVKSLIGAYSTLTRKQGKSSSTNMPQEDSLRLKKEFLVHCCGYSQQEADDILEIDGFAKGGIK